MFGKRLILLACCLPLLNVALGEDKGGNSAPLTISHQAPQVKLVRLNHADAEAIVAEFSRIIPADDLRIVADKRTNSVLIAAPAATQDMVADLIAKLDVAEVHNKNSAPAPSETTAVIPLTEGNPDLVAKALRELVATRQAQGKSSAIAVVKASPSVQKALETVLQPPATQPGQVQYPVLKPPFGNPDTTAGTAGQGIQVLHLSHQQATALTKVLGPLSPKTSKPGVIVVVPEGSKNPQAPASGEKNAPTLP